MPKVKILRGIPGAGKTTYAHQHYSLDELVSADAYFFDKKTSQYFFDSTQIGDAHAQCLRKFVGLLVARATDIIVDNTNITVAEIAPYYALAQAYGYDVEIVCFIVVPAKAAGRNVHGVRLNTIKRKHAVMIEETSRLPAWWALRYVTDDDGKKMSATSSGG